MKETRQKLTLDRTVMYQIKVSGHLDKSWSTWATGMTMSMENEGNDTPVTILTGTLADQAALHSLLRKIYALGVPLISVNLVEPRDE